MGPAFANLLEIGGDQYEYIQSVIAHDFRVIGQKVLLF